MPRAFRSQRPASACPSGRVRPPRARTPGHPAPRAAAQGNAGTHHAAATLRSEEAIGLTESLPQGTAGETAWQMRRDLSSWDSCSLNVLWRIHRALGVFSESLVADGQQAQLLGRFGMRHVPHHKTKCIGDCTIAVALSAFAVVRVHNGSTAARGKARESIPRTDALLPQTICETACRKWPTAKEFITQCVGLRRR